jgi:hypothetical protein
MVSFCIVIDPRDCAAVPTSHETLRPHSATDFLFWLLCARFAYLVCARLRISLLAHYDFHVFSRHIYLSGCFPFLY